MIALGCDSLPTSEQMFFPSFSPDRHDHLGFVIDILPVLEKSAPENLPHPCAYSRTFTLLNQTVVVKPGNPMWKQSSRHALRGGIVRVMRSRAKPGRTASSACYIGGVSETQAFVTTKLSQHPCTDGCSWGGTFRHGWESGESTRHEDPRSTHRSSSTFLVLSFSSRSHAT